MGIGHVRQWGYLPHQACKTLIKKAVLRRECMAVGPKAGILLLVCMIMSHIAGSCWWTLIMLCCAANNASCILAFPLANCISQCRSNQEFGKQRRNAEVQALGKLSKQTRSVHCSRNEMAGIWFSKVRTGRILTYVPVAQRCSVGRQVITTEMRHMNALAHPAGAGRVCKQFYWLSKEGPVVQRVLFWRTRLAC